MTRETFIRSWRRINRWARSIDTGGLRRLVVFTYFGVYAFLFVAHLLVNRFVFALPARVRPPPVAPVWEVLALPQSVAMALFSSGITLLVVGTVMIRDVFERRDTPAPSIRGSLSSVGVPPLDLPSPRVFLPGELQKLDVFESTGEQPEEPVSTDGSGDGQREPEAMEVLAERGFAGSASQLDLTDAESNADEWPGEWVSGDEL